MKTKKIKKNHCCQFKLTAIGVLLTTAAFAQTPNLLVCADRGYTLSPVADKAAAGTSLVYKWYEKTNTGNYQVMSSQTIASLSVSANTKSAGTYSYVRTVTGTDCATEVPSNTYTVVVNALPDTPTTPSANRRCGSGTVTFSANVPGGHTIDWYDASGAGSIVDGGRGVTSFSSTLTATTTYYAQARNTTTACVSASRLAVAGTVNAYGASGSTPGMCGCAPELTDCAGICSASASCWFATCEGFTQVSSVSSEGSTNWTLASRNCASKGSGWRLPSVAELECLCGAEPPESFSFIESYYWSSSVYTNLGHMCVRMNDCRAAGGKDEEHWQYVCVRN